VEFEADLIIIARITLSIKCFFFLEKSKQSRSRKTALGIMSLTPLITQKITRGTIGKRTNGKRVYKVKIKTKDEER